MSSFSDDMYAGIPSTVAPRQPRVPEPLPAAWQATADNKVTRHYTSTAAAEQYRVGEQRIGDLRTRLVGTSAAIDKILRELDEMDRVLAGAPSKELAAAQQEVATAQQALVDLKKRNDNLIVQCRQWKKRATDAEAARERAEDMAEQLQRQQPQTPNAVYFIRKGTPGDSVRFLAGEVMKHAVNNLELAGTAMALNMVAADVDSLPQGSS